MPNNGMRVVIDTNIWISFLIGKSLAGLTNAIIANRVQVLFSDDLFSELLEVLQRPKLKKYFTSTAIEQLLALLYEKIAWVNVVDEFTDCRDKKDNFLLNLSVSGQANYLIRRCRFAGVKSLSWCKNCFLSVFSKCDFG